MPVTYITGFLVYIYGKFDNNEAVSNHHVAF